MIGTSTRLFFLGLCLLNLHFDAWRVSPGYVIHKARRGSSLSATTNEIPTSSGALGSVESLIDYLSSDLAIPFVRKIVLRDEKLRKEYEGANFWSGGSFVVNKCKCTGVIEQGLVFEVECDIRGKIQQRDVLAPFPSPVKDDYELKRRLVEIAAAAEMYKETANIATLPFGENVQVPKDIRFNDVPHAPWVRDYMYESATDAVRKAIRDPTIPNKSRMQMKVNFPEVNPAFDTYRIGTILEMVRHTVLALTLEEGKRVRICVQQSLGEGVFCGLPLALASMRPVLERMDWGPSLTPAQKAQPGDVQSPRPEALIRYGQVGANQIADDDDVVIVIAPQNVVGAMVIELLNEMCVAARGRPVILLNPSLEDRPSSNNMMQVRGRSERRAIQDSFVDIFAVRLLYPSSGGYMFPIRGLVVKKDYQSLWVVYRHDDVGEDACTVEDGKAELCHDEFNVIGAFPANPRPDTEAISNLFTGR